MHTYFHIFLAFPHKNYNSNTSWIVIFANRKSFGCKSTHNLTRYRQEKTSWWHRASRHLFTFPGRPCKLLFHICNSFIYTTINFRRRSKFKNQKTQDQQFHIHFSLVFSQMEGEDMLHRLNKFQLLIGGHNLKNRALVGENGSNLKKIQQLVMMYVLI